MTTAHRRARATRHMGCVNDKGPWRVLITPPGHGRDLYVERNYRTCHGLTLAHYEEMLAAQDGRCAICGTDKPGGKHGKRFHIDHDHSCCPSGKSCEKCRRALLCANCNVGLGALGDDPDRLIAAASYLLSHGKRTAT